MRRIQNTVQGGNSSLRPLALTMMLAAVLASVMNAQPSDTITANPKAVALRQVWSVHGSAGGGDRVGEGIGSVSDINGDSIDDFAVFYGAAGEWRIYYGGREPISSEPAMILKQFGDIPSYPIVGDFWGSGRKAVAFDRYLPEEINGQTYKNNFLYVYRLDSNRIDTAHPSAILDPGKMTPWTIVSFHEMAAADLDGDGADELIVFNTGFSRAGVVSKISEVWIYRGGPQFRLDSPTVILRDNEERGGAGALMVGRWDSDKYLDVAIGLRYSTTQKLKFWFGAPGTPWNWTTPDREVQFGGIVALDCDGDGVLDAVAPPLDSFRVRLFRSGTGKSWRTRTLAYDDIDTTYYCKGYHNPARLGYLSDSANRYEMFAIFGGPGPTFLGLNGGPQGSDHTYDLYSYAANFALLEPIGDVTGDGWNDLMSSYVNDNFDAGAAVVYAGGPYIPRDSLTMGIDEIPVAGMHDAISVWPNPARDDLHIAWRGDLHRMPSRFVVHDLLGREIARGDVESWRGEAFWNCSPVAAGTYLVSMFDADGAFIATARIMKE